MQLKKEDEEALKEKAQKTSVVEGSAYAVMDGFGLRYITPFAVALGAKNILIGLLGSLPQLFGTFSQLLSLKAIEKYSRKTIVSICVLLQALFWLPIISIGVLYFTYNLNSTITSIFLLIIYTLLITAGSFGSPPWNSWMRDIIPKNSGKYFGKRSTVTGIIALVSMLLGGLILDYFSANGKILIAFATLFSIASFGRAVSALLFTVQYEPKFVVDKNAYFSLKQFIQKMRYNNFGRFVFFVSLMSGAVAIASPFFAVYMLKDLGFENWYIAFTAVSMASVIATLASTQLWGKFLDKYGNVVVLKINGILVSFIPLLWLATHWLKNYLGTKILIYLLLIEAFSGIVWAGFSLSSAIFIYQAVTKERMALCVTYHSIISATITVIGATIGGILATKQILNFNPLLFVFVLSAVLRFISAILINIYVKEVREVEKLSFNQIKNLFHKFSHIHILNSAVRRAGTSITPAH